MLHCTPVAVCTYRTVYFTKDNIENYCPSIFSRNYPRDRRRAIRTRSRDSRFQLSNSELCIIWFKWFECLESQKAWSKHRLENMVSFSWAILTLYHEIHHKIAIFQKYNWIKQYLIYYVNCVSGDRKSSWLTLLLFVTLNKSIFNELLFQNN